MNIKISALAGCLLLAGVCAAKERDDYQKGRRGALREPGKGIEDRSG